MIASSEETPAISVVTAVRNEERYVRAAVESILSQTFEGFEYLIVDDASTDATARILDGFSDPRIVRVRLDEGHGAAEARNVALRRARGRYVAVQDADDVSLPDRLERELSYLEAHPNVAMVGSGIVIMDERGRPTRIDVPQRELHHVGLCHGSVMFRRACVDAVGYYRESLLRSQDREFMRRVSERYDTVKLPQVLYEFRLVGKKRTVRSVLRQCRYDMLADEIARRPEIAPNEGALRALRETRLHPRPLSRQWWNGHGYVARWCRYYGRLFLAQHRYGFAVRHYAAALLFEPPGVGLGSRARRVFESRARRMFDSRAKRRSKGG